MRPMPSWTPPAPGEFGIENITTGQVDELHVDSLRAAACQLQLTREGVPILVKSLKDHEAAGTATPTLRMIVAAEQAARYRVVHRTVTAWKEVK